MVLMMKMNLLHSIYIVYFEPFDTKQQNWIEFYNEALIVTITICMCCFTQMVRVPEPKQTVGWYIIFLFLISLVINIGIMIKNTYRRPYLKCRKKYALYRRNG